MAARKITGKIVSTKMLKTVVVSIEVVTKHALYNKTVKNTTRLKARNEIDAKLNDMVVIQECAPFSKQVSWKVVEVLASVKGEK
jgi:small subunit ribosomal protein S17